MISLDPVRVWCTFIVPYGPSVMTHQNPRTSIFSRLQICLSSCGLSEGPRICQACKSELYSFQQDRLYNCLPNMEEHEALTLESMLYRN